MDRDELELWLSEDQAYRLSPREIAQSLGLPAEELADTTLLRVESRVMVLRFTLAVLQDAFACDLDVWQWLEMPRRELGGLTARAALVGRLEDEVECLAVQTWNAHVSMAGAA